MPYRQKEISEHRIRTVARIYNTNRYAAEALGIAPGSFERLCKHYGVQSPAQRRQKAREGLQRKTYCQHCDTLLVWPQAVCGACKGKGIFVND